MLPLSDSHPTGKFPFWTAVIIAVTSLVFFFELTSPDTEAFIAQYALIPAQVDFGNLTTLFPFITSQFLHGGFVHILSNMWFLWVFGDNVEERLGFFLFPLLYVVFGIIGGLTQYIFIPDSTLPMLGASGAVAGVLGAYFVMFPRHTIKTLVPVGVFLTTVNIPASIMLFYWFFTQLFSGTATIVAGAAAFGGVAWFAHIGGFVSGWLVGKSFTRPRRKVELEVEEGEVIE